jgi:hypothetical protein
VPFDYQLLAAHFFVVAALLVIAVVALLVSQHRQGAEYAQLLKDAGAH